MRLLFLICLALLQPFTTFAVAGDSALHRIDISKAGEHQSLGQQIAYLVDSHGTLQVDDVMRLRPSDWRYSHDAALNLGMTSAPHWFSLTLNNQSDRPATRLLELSYGLLDYVEFHVVQDGIVGSMIETGDQRPMSSRPLFHRNFVFPVEVPAQDEVQVLIRVKTHGSMQVPLDLWDLKAFFEHDQISLSVQILFVGIMLALAMYNGFLFLATRDWSYFWYVMSMLSIMIVVLSFHGVTAQFLWANQPVFNNPTLVAGISVNVFSGSLFAYFFLHLHRHGKPIRTLVLGIAASGAVVFILNFFVPYGIATAGASLISVVAAVSLILIAVYLWYRGEVLARFYTIAWISLLVGSVLITLSKYGILPRNLLLEHAQQIGAVAEGLLLSFALAYRMNLERRRRFLVQRELLQVQQEANDVLEQRVKERTTELEVANRKLMEANAVDGLTQVKNRGFFEQMLAHEWNKGVRGPSQMSLLMIDGDHFKRVNDTYGHLCGDACLQHLAQIYQSSVCRTGDFVARYGGEEFVVLLCLTDLDGAACVAERIREAVANSPLEWEGQRIPLSVSIGVSSCVPKPFEDMKVLIKEADEALYAAKNGGRNRVMLYRHSARSAGVVEATNFTGI